jgi:hypothetical protein
MTTFGMRRGVSAFDGGLFHDSGTPFARASGREQFCRHMIRWSSTTLLLLASASLLAGCDRTERSHAASSVTVQLPPARPYRPAGPKPGFSQALLPGTHSA